LGALQGGIVDRTASAGAEQGEEGPAGRLPFRRPSAREVAAEGDDKPQGWFGDPKPSESGSISSPVVAPGSPVVPSRDGSEPAPPEFGPASPSGPGRVSFGFSDGPIGGVRAPRGRGADDTGGLRRVGPDDTGGLRRIGADDTGGLRRVGADDTGGMRRVDGDGDGLPTRKRGRGDGSEAAELPRRRRGDTGDLPRVDTGNLPRAGREDGVELPRRRGDTSDDLPIVRKSGNGTDGPSWPADSDPFSVGIGTLPADAAATGSWPEPIEAGSSRTSFDAGLSRASSFDAATGSGGASTGLAADRGRRDEPMVWADTLPPAVAASVTPAGPAAPGAPAGPPPRRQSRLVTAGMAFLGVVALAVIAATGVVYYSGGDNQITDVLGGGKDDRVVSGPLEDRTLATFELLAATDRVQLRIADLGDDLYRISSPEGAGIKPSAEVREDRLRVDVTRDDAGTGGEVEVVLAAKVRWTIRFSGYSAERIVDLSAGRIKGIEMVGGTRRAELTLADAAGTVPMKITGGVEELILRAPTGSPVRVKVGGGAGTVTAGAKTLRDVPPGSTLTPKDWTTGNRYDVDAVAPVTLLTGGTTPPTPAGGRAPLTGRVWGSRPRQLSSGRAGGPSAPWRATGPAPRRGNRGRCR
jgi:hypothetical protein